MKPDGKLREAINALNGLTYMEWLKLERNVNKHFEDIKKENVLNTARDVFNWDNDILCPLTATSFADKRL